MITTIKANELASNYQLITGNRLEDAKDISIRVVDEHGDVILFNIENLNRNNSNFDLEGLLIKINHEVI